MKKVPPTLTQRSKHRRSFTLVEMLVVVALVVVMAALAYPSLDTMYADYKVSAAADEVRARFAEARAQAATEGRPYRFSVVPNQGNFRIAPDSPEFWAGSEAPEEIDPETGPALIRDGALPSGICFTFGTDTVPDFSVETALAPEAVGSEMWASVVSFLPDGTALALDGTDAEEVKIIIQGKNATPVLLTLRTLTGTVVTRSMYETIGH